MHVIFLIPVRFSVRKFLISRSCENMISYEHILLTPKYALVRKIQFRIHVLREPLTHLTPVVVRASIETAFSRRNPRSVYTTVHLPKVCPERADVYLCYRRIDRAVRRIRRSQSHAFVVRPRRVTTRPR